VCRLNKSLYDLKQALRVWYHCFTSYLVSLGFVEAKLDTSLFVYRHDADTAYLLLYMTTLYSLPRAQSFFSVPLQLSSNSSR
jgi:hypothetical protein